MVIFEATGIDKYYPGATEYEIAGFFFISYNAASRKTGNPQSRSNETPQNQV